MCDLGSKNGIFLHGNRVQESDLQPGDRLTIGGTEITVQYRRAGQPAAAEAASNQPAKPGSLNRPTEELLYSADPLFGRLPLYFCDDYLGALF